MTFTLQELGLLDSPAEKEFDNLTSLACEIIGVPTAHVSILDLAKERIFYKSQNGHDEALATARELPMELTYCQHVALTKAPVIVSDARQHPLLKGTPALEDGPLAYLGVPIVAPERQVIGGLCMMQPDCRMWSEAEIARAKKLAACVSDLVRLRAETLTSERLRTEQRDFTYAISHDLRSPANTVRMIIDEIAEEQDKLSEDARELIKESFGTLDRMGRQIEDVLHYSRTLSSDAAFTCVDLNAVAADTISDLRQAIGATGAEIQCDLLPSVRGEATQLGALFQNFICNAIKFVPSGRRPVIRIRSEPCDEPGEVRIVFQDNGIGIAPENQSRVFDLFGRLNLRDSYEGTGIGLTLCRRVVDNHNGRIEIRSDGKTGTEFHVQLGGRLS